MAYLTPLLVIFHISTKTVYKMIIEVKNDLTDGFATDHANMVAI